MKNFTIVASLFLLVGCATGHKQVTPAPVVDNKIISEAEKYKKQYQKKIYKTWDIPKSSTGMSASVKVGEFKHEVRQFQKPYDNQQAEQISLMV